MAEVTQQQYDQILELTGSDEQAGAVVRVLGLVLPTPPPVNTINSIAVDDTHVEPSNQITIEPIIVNGSVQWLLYIPPTTVDAFEFGENYEDYDPLVNDIRAPWGTTYWDSLQGAIGSLSVARQNGDIKFNDGRAVQ